MTALPGSDPQALGFWPASSKSPLAHSNGGAEAFTTFAFAGEIELTVRLPHPVISATLRPSMRHAVPVQIAGDTVRFTLYEPRYLCLEINYGSADAPWHTIYILPEPPSDEQEAVQIRGAGILDGHRRNTVFSNATTTAWPSKQDAPPG